MPMNPELKAKIDAIRAEDAKKWDRIADLTRQHGIDTMSVQQLRDHLLTVDGKGKEVKTSMLDRLINDAIQQTWEQAHEAYDNQ